MASTRRKITANITEKTSVKAEYFDLSKYEGEYYWGGQAGACFISTCTYYRTLHNLESYTDDFLSRLKEWYETRNAIEHQYLESATYHDMGDALNRYIENIDWRVNDEQQES